jgi:peroxiredoxin
MRVPVVGRAVTAAIGPSSFKEEAMNRLFAAALSTLLLLVISAHPALAFGRVAVGDQLPDFRLPALGGEVFQLSEALGTKATLVVFWATWNPRSTEALADLQELYAQHGPLTLVVIAINVDGEQATPERTKNARSTIERVGARYPVVIDERLDVYGEFGVVAVPSTVLVDPSRRVVSFLDGYPATTRVEFREEIVGLLRTAGSEAARMRSGIGGPTPRGEREMPEQLRMGRLYLKKGNRERAVRYLSRAVAENPYSQDVCADLVALLGSMKRYDEAARVEAQLTHLRTAGGSASLR